MTNITPPDPTRGQTVAGTNSTSFAPATHSTPDKPVAPAQFIWLVEPGAPRSPELFEQHLSDEQEDKLCQARDFLGTIPFIQPSSVRLPNGLEGPSEAVAYFIDEPDMEVLRMTVAVDGTIGALEWRDGEEWTDLEGGGLWEDFQEAPREDLEARNSFADPLTERQDRVLLRFNDYRYGLNTSTRPDGEGGVEAINFSTDNDELRRVRINADGFVTSLAVLDNTVPTPSWSEFDPESAEFRSVAEDTLTFEERVRRMKS